MIIHCMKKSLWEQRKNEREWGESELSRSGFIHCSTAAYFWRVAPNFRSVAEPLVLLMIDEDKLLSPVRYEDGGDTAVRLYPHVYGKINNDAVIGVLPFLRDSDGNYVKNPELADIKDE